MMTYSELLLLPTIDERYKALRRCQNVAARTFGGDRYLNQAFYKSREWRTFRHSIVVRDGGWDLAVEGYPVDGVGYVHHINPITLEQLVHGEDCLLDPENVILCSFSTHNAIHYGIDSSLHKDLIERRPGDTCPWR